MGLMRLLLLRYYNKIPENFSISPLPQEITFLLECPIDKNSEIKPGHNTLMPRSKGDKIYGSIFSIVFNLKMLLFSALFGKKYTFTYQIFLSGR